MMPSVYHESARFGTGTMYRILNTQGVFKAMAKRNFNNQTIKIKFNVIDSFFPANEGSIILHFNQGNLSLENDGFYDVEIDIDVSELSSLVIGSVNFRAMYDFSLITGKVGLWVFNGIKNFNSKFCFLNFRQLLKISITLRF